MQNYDLTFEFLCLLPVFSNGHTGHTLGIILKQQRQPLTLTLVDNVKVQISLTSAYRPCGTLISYLYFVIDIRFCYITKQHTRIGLYCRLCGYKLSFETTGSEDFSRFIIQEALLYYCVFVV